MNTVSEVKTRALLILKNSILAALDDDVHAMAGAAISDALTDPPKPGQKMQVNFTLTMDCGIILQSIATARDTVSKRNKARKK